MRTIWEIWQVWGDTPRLITRMFTRADADSWIADSGGFVVERVEPWHRGF